MFESLKEKYQSLTGKNNKKSVSQIFQNPEYVQDSHERHAQILIYKLMMIAAYADGSVDEEELNLIKDYAFEQCLTENEWAEINFFSQVQPSREELLKIYREILSEVRSSKERKKILNAVREIINADDLIKDEEKSLIEILEKETEEMNIPVAGNLIKKLKAGYSKKVGNSISDSDSVAYSMNPVMPLLKKANNPDVAGKEEIIAAKLGLAIVLINADMDFHENEKEAFVNLTAKECSLADEAAEKLTEEIIKIPDNDFEISHLSRVLTESLSADERKNFLAELFKIARADQVYDAYEDKYLRIISNSMMLTHNDFIAVKLRR